MCFHESYPQIRSFRQCYAKVVWSQVVESANSTSCENCEPVREFDKSLNEYQSNRDRFDVRYTVQPTYPPPHTAKKSTILTNVQPHPDLSEGSRLSLFPLDFFGGCLRDFAGSPFPPPLFPALPPMSPPGRAGGDEYKLYMSSRRMSKLSLSSPVSALKPRYETEGRLTAPMSKHVVHSFAALYCSSSFSESSW